MHCIPLQVSKKKKRNTCMLMWEMLHDFIILITLLLYLFNQGDFHESFLFFSRGEGGNLSFQDAGLCHSNRKSTTHKSGEISQKYTHKSGVFSENHTHKSGNAKTAHQ